MKTFNSLSRDHCFLSKNQGVSGPSFQLPLSGSHELVRKGYYPNRAFNSLSRDHAPPSRACPASARSAFQLPLSGSRATLIAFLISAPLLTFNSLSRDHYDALLDVHYCDRPRVLSTPSLGITRGPGTSPRRSPRSPPSPFNSLSRDHRARFRDFPALRGFLPRHLFAQMISKATI
jgi:hypothetical protein